MRHIVALSGGKDSTAMALALREAEPALPFEYAITPTGDELPVMVEHWKRLAELLGAPLVPLTRLSLAAEIRRRRCLPNHRMRWCTRVLKVEPFQHFLLSAAPATVYVGIRADETHRDAVDWEEHPGITRRFPLAEWGWDKPRVLGYLEQRGVCVPERTDCAMCFFQRIGEWWRLWRLHPDAFAQAEALELEIGHTFRSDGRDSWPASLTDLRREFESGRTPRGADQPNLFSVEDRPGMCAVCSR